MGREPREVWEKRVERWRESGLSAREFAAEIGVNAHTLSGWAWRLSGRDGRPDLGRRRRQDRPSAAASVAAVPPVKFVELMADDASRSVTVPAAAAASPAIELLVGAGRTLRVPSGFDPESLRRLLAVLETV